MSKRVNCIKLINSNGNVLAFWKKVSVQFADHKGHTVTFTDEHGNIVTLMIGNNVTYIEEYLDSK